MIKNLLNADEDPPPGTKVIVEETVLNPPTEPQNTEPPSVENTAENLETRSIFEVPEDAKFFAPPTGAGAVETPQVSETTSIAEPAIETPNGEFVNLETPEPKSENPITAGESAGEKMNYETSGTLFQSEVKPPTAAETIRQSGMAYSAAIVLFGSVVFMMILGGFSDLLLGSSPWGIVGGIFLGGIIGFIQFFRITSQIFKK
jgi:F0F1-type ATP synthase assembly protein I